MKISINPDPPILAFFSISLLFFPISLAFCAFFFSFPRILGFPRREKPLLFGGFPLLSSKKQGLEGQGRMIILCMGGSFFFFFMRSSEIDFLSISGPSGFGAL